VKLSKGLVLIGADGSATDVVMTGKPPTPDQAATLRTFFLDCPGQSPAWQHYLLSIIHLRPIEGVREAVIRFPGATHEVLIVALDPSKKPTATKRRSWSFLWPTNLEQQVQLDNDDQAHALLLDCARAVVDGRLWAEPPLSGQVEPWRTVLIKTAAHYRGEIHAP
jgi:hypothetical protein